MQLRNTNSISFVRASRFLLVAALVLIVWQSTAPEANALTITPKLEINANPGETVREIFRVQNEQRQSQTYYLSFANFSSKDETGNPIFLEKKEDLATWISAPDSVTLGPNESKDILITIRVPVNADPGGHFSAIFLQATPPSSSGSQVAVNSKLGSLILLRVAGDFTQEAGILEFATKARHRFFSSLPITFFYRFQNTGDDHVKPLGDILITNTIGRTSKVLPANPVDGSVLPASVRRFESSWVESGKPLNEKTWEALPEAPRSFWKAAGYQWKNFAFGKYKASLKIVYGTKELKSTRATFTFFVIPWQLLIIAIPSLVILLCVAWLLIKRYNRYIINRAQKYKRK